METTIDKQDLKDWIDRLDNEAYLVTLKSIKCRSTGKDFWHELPKQTKQAIKKGQRQLNEGKGIPHDQVRARIKEQFLQ